MNYPAEILSREVNEKKDIIFTYGPPIPRMRVGLFRLKKHKIQAFFFIQKAIQTKINPLYELFFESR